MTHQWRMTQRTSLQALSKQQVKSPAYLYSALSPWLIGQTRGGVWAGQTGSERSSHRAPNRANPPWMILEHQILFWGAYQTDRQTDAGWCWLMLIDSMTSSKSLEFLNEIVHQISSSTLSVSTTNLVIPSDSVLRITIFHYFNLCAFASGK